MDIQKRRNFFIDARFQTKFIIKFCLIVIASSILMGLLLFILSRNFTTVAIENTHVTVKRMSDFILPIIFLIVPLVTAFSALSVIILTLYTSHKIAGPLYRLCKEIGAFKNGNLNANFRTRRTDQLQELAASLTDLRSSCYNKHLEYNKILEDLKSYLQKSDIDKDLIIKKVDELERSLNYFKI